MTANAFCRVPRRILGSLQLGISAQETSNRRGQDKNRKVRPVGSVRNSVKLGLVANIAKSSRNLHFSTMRYRCSIFDTLRRNR